MSARPPAAPGKPRRRRVIAIKTLLVFILSACCLWWMLPTQARLTLYAEKQGVFAGFSPDSQTFATMTMSKEGKGQFCGPVRLWDVQTGQERLQFAADQKSIRDCLFSPDGKVLATIGYDHLCTLWNTSTGQAEGTAPAEPPQIQFGSAARFTPDGSILAVACPNLKAGDWISMGEDLRLYDMARREIRATIAGVRCYAFSPDSKTVAVAENVEDTVWQRRLLGCLATLGSPFALPPPVNTFDWRSTVGGMPYQVVKVRDAATGEVRQTLPGQMYLVTSIAFSPDGGSLAIAASSAEEVRFWGNPAEVRIWDVAAGRDKITFNGDLVGRPPGSRIDSLQYGGDGRTLTTTYGPTSVLWDLTADPPKQILALPYASVLSPDGSLLAVEDGKPVNLVLTVGFTDSHVNLLELPSMKEKSRLGVNGWAYSNKPKGFTPDGRTLAVEQYYHPGWGTPLRTCRRAVWRIFPGGSSSNGDFFESEVKFFDVTTGRVVGAVTNPPDWFVLTFAPDGRTMVCSRWSDEKVQFYDVPPGPPWLYVFGIAAMLTGLVFLLGLFWRRRKRAVA
jgi:WD40 repeat protein